MAQGGTRDASGEAGEEPAVSFGDALRDFRRAAGLTQEELAAQARLSAKAISALERGVNGAPRRDTLLQLMKALRLSARDRSTLEAAARQSRGRAAPVRSSAEPAPVAHRDAVPGGRLLVGRAAELALLDRHLRRDIPPVLVFAGEPGMGKTRLLREAARRAESHGFAVVAGGCRRGSGQEPYAPLPSALEQHLAPLPPGAMSAALEGCGWLSRLLPELVDKGAVAPPPAQPPDQERRLIFTAVARFLANVAGQAGTLLALDDLQWASLDALDLLASLAATADARRLLVVVACHNTDRQSRAALWGTLTDLARAGLAHVTDLAPLSPSEAEELLDDLLPAAVEHADVRAIVRRTGGGPFFLVSCADAAQAASGAGAGTLGVPWTVAGSVRQRMAALPGDGTRVLGAAAVVGRHVPLDVLRAVAARANIEPEELRATIDAACRDRLLVDEGNDGVQFAHDLIRESVEAELGPGQRAALHRWAAEAIEQVHADPLPEILAYHFTRGGERERAAKYLARAADRALALRAHAEAAGALDELAAHLDALGRLAEAASARERQGAALTTAARYDEALAALEHAAGVYQARGDEEGLARTMAKIGDVHALRVTSDEGITRLRAALRSFGTPGPSARALAAMYVSLAWLINTKGRFAEALPVAERAAELAEAAGDTTLLVQANLRRGHLLLMLQRIDEGIRVFRNVLPVVQAGEDLRSLRFALNNLGWIHEARGKFAVDRTYTERALDAALRLDDPSLVAYMRSNHGSPAFNLGDWLQARADFEDGVALMCRLRPSWASAWPPLLLGQLCVAEGRQDEGERLLNEAIAHATQNTDLQALRWAHGTLAERELLQGEPERAVARLEPLLDRPGERVIDVTVLLPLLAWANGDMGLEGKAAHNVEEAIRRAEAGRMLPALASALRVRGQLWQRRGRWDDARRDLARALGLARHMRYPYDEAKTLHRLGLLEAAVGDPRLAYERLMASVGILSRLGERLYLGHVRQDVAHLARTEVRQRVMA